MATEQQPIEMILARGLASNLTTPAFLVDTDGTLVFFNEAAGELLGVRFEESERMDRDEWGTRFEPLDADGQAIPVEELPLAIALRDGRPAHSSFYVTPVGGGRREIEVC